MKDGTNLDILYYLENVAYIFDSQNLQNLFADQIYRCNYKNVNNI